MDSSLTRFPSRAAMGGIVDSTAGAAVDGTAGVGPVAERVGEAPGAASRELVSPDVLPGCSCDGSGAEGSAGSAP